ncbi:Yip1 family protein [Desulfotruncus alcoholivorax]|uniref:Yip1 family protein n=1 Tax=Desulfotruncus alcoholivorax TaxID=265477 RepID=UPI000411D192|nr:Yip1 family protein [Desulfotruncus alcoholivorax]
MENQDGAHKTGGEEQNENVYPEQDREIILNNDEINLNSKPESRSELDQAGMLELIYGTLFDPARTFAGFASNPRIGAAVLVFFSVNILEALMGYYTTPRFFQSLRIPGMLEYDYVKVTAILVAAGGFLFGLVKWFVMSGLLHLLSELLGGRGGARNVFAVYGLAGLPVVFMLPVQVMLMVFPGGFLQALTAALCGIAVFVWSTVLLVIGLREVHQFSAGKAILVVIAPWSIIVVLAIVSIVVIGSSIAGLQTGRFI